MISKNIVAQRSTVYVKITTGLRDVYVVLRDKV